MPMSKLVTNRPASTSAAKVGDRRHETANDTTMVKYYKNLRNMITKRNEVYHEREIFSSLEVFLTMYLLVLDVTDFVDSLLSPTWLPTNI